MCIVIGKVPCLHDIHRTSTNLPINQGRHTNTHTTHTLTHTHTLRVESPYYYACLPACIYLLIERYSRCQTFTRKYFTTFLAGGTGTTALLCDIYTYKYIIYMGNVCVHKRKLHSAVVVKIMGWGMGDTVYISNNVLCII